MQHIYAVSVSLLTFSFPWPNVLVGKQQQPNKMGALSVD